MNEKQKLEKYLTQTEKELYNELVKSLNFLIKLAPYIKTDKIVYYGATLWQDPIHDEFPIEFQRVKSEKQKLKDKAQARYVIDEHKKGRKF